MEKWKECFDKDYMCINPFKEVLKNVPQQDEMIVKALEYYYNGKELIVQKNKKQINDYFLYQLLTRLMDCEYPFWKKERMERESRKLMIGRIMGVLIAIVCIVLVVMNLT